METKELRPGNIINYLGDDGKWFVIDVGSISDDGVELFCDYDETLLCGYSKDRIKPVELTEKRVIRFGFTVHYDELCKTLTCEDGIFPNTETHIVWDKEKKECYLDVKFEYIILRKIKYVHQLQNIFFLFTGEELVKGDADLRVF